MDLENQDEIEQEARRLGWAPEEEFRGNKEKWVDAKEYLERGEQLMPILKQNNKRLQKELSTRDQKIGMLETKLQNFEVAFEKLEKHYTEANKRAVETAKAQLKGELKQAREDNDVDLELEIQDKLRDISAREDELKNTPVVKKSSEPTDPKDKGFSPEFLAWKKENPWFEVDMKRTRKYVHFAEDIRAEDPNIKWDDLIAQVEEMYEEQYGSPEEEEDEPKPARRPASKVESSANRGGRRTGGKTFADLPREAKEACWDDVDDLVGPDKRYKTKKDWETAYAKIYFAEEN